MLRSFSKNPNSVIVTFANGIEITLLPLVKVAILSTPDPGVSDKTYAGLEAWLNKKGYFLQVLAPETDNASFANRT